MLHQQTMLVVLTAVGNQIEGSKDHLQAQLNRQLHQQLKQRPCTSKGTLPRRAAVTDASCQCCKSEKRSDNANDRHQNAFIRCEVADWAGNFGQLVRYCFCEGWAGKWWRPEEAVRHENYPLNNLIITQLWPLLAVTVVLLKPPRQ